MSDSDDEYGAIRQVSLARKRALFAELGVDNLNNEFKKTFASSPNHSKVRNKVRKKIVENGPSRRSLRIQKKVLNVKYVKGFKGFESDTKTQISTVEVIDETTSKFSKGPESEKNEVEVSFDSHSKFPKRSGCDTSNGKQVVGKGHGNICSPVNSFSEFSLEHEKSEKIEEKCKNSVVNKDAIDSMENCVENNGKITVSKVIVRSKNINSTNSMLVKEEGNELLNLDNPVVSKFFEGNVSVTEEITPGEATKNFMETTNISPFLNTPWNMRSEKVCLEIIKNSFKESSKFNAFLKHENENLDSDDDWSGYEEIKFVLSTSEDSDTDTGFDDNEFDGNDSHRKQRRTHNFGTSLNTAPTLSCEEVTAEMIANIAKRSSGKVYDKEKGTTCHQCRQKTLDTKTVCRSGRCSGVRGMFCGICLLKRYGESVQEALKNPKWECPVCREICNCSFCRTRAGKDPTGIMYPEARQQGYSSVLDYLKDKENKKQKVKKFLVIGNAGIEIKNEKEVSLFS